MSFTNGKKGTPLTWEVYKKLPLDQKIVVAICIAIGLLPFGIIAYSIFF